MDSRRPSSGPRLPPRTPAPAGPRRGAWRLHRSGPVQQRERGIHARSHGVLRIAAHGHHRIAVAQEERGAAAAAQPLATVVADPSENFPEIAIPSGVVPEIAIPSGVGKVTVVTAGGVLAEGGERGKQKRGRDDKGPVHPRSPHLNKLSGVMPARDDFRRIVVPLWL